MIFAIELSLCIMAWIVTISRMKTIHWRDVREDGGIALHVWLMMVFFSITSIFLIKEFSDLFDAYTLNNLDRLISYSSLLTGMTFGAMAAIEAVGKPSTSFVYGHYVHTGYFVKRYRVQGISDLLTVRNGIDHAH